MVTPIPVTLGASPEGDTYPHDNAVFLGVEFAGDASDAGDADLDHSAQGELLDVMPEPVGVAGDDWRTR